MTENGKAGRRLIVIIIGVVLALEVFILVPMNLLVAAQELPTQAVRIVLTCVLLFFLYRGYGWARWISVVLFFLGGLGLLAVAAMFAGAQIGSLFVAMTLLVGVIFLSAGGALLFSSSIKSFFAECKAERAERRLPVR